MVYSRARYYDPDTGRFTQPDPIGLSGGTNLYAYAGGDPVNYTDPMGTSPNAALNNFLEQTNSPFAGLLAPNSVVSNNDLSFINSPNNNIALPSSVTSGSSSQSNKIGGGGTLVAGVRPPGSPSQDDVNYFVPALPGAGAVIGAGRQVLGLGAAVKGQANIRQMGLGNVNLGGKSFNAGRKALEKSGFVLQRTTATGRKIFRNPKTGATITHDSGKALGAGQNPHWTIQDKGGQFYNRSGRPITGPSSQWVEGTFLQGER